MRTKDLPLWEKRRQPYGLAKILNQELSNHPGKFNQIVYSVARIDLDPYNQTDGAVPGSLRFFDEVKKAFVPEQIPILRGSNIIDKQPWSYDFSEIDEKLHWLAYYDVLYLYVLIEENIYYNYNIVTRMVVIDPRLELGYGHLAPQLDRDAESWSEDLFKTVKMPNSKRILLYDGPTYLDHATLEIRKTA